MTAAFGIGDTPVINVTMGRAVGGSSLLTGGVCFRTPDDVLDLWVNERGLRDLSPELLRPYFEQVEADAHIGSCRPRCARAPRRSSTKALGISGTRCTRRAETPAAAWARRRATARTSPRRAST